MGELADRIDAGRGDAVPPPRRRWRLVLDLEADDLDGLFDVLTMIDFDIRGEVREWSGGWGSGYHVELIENAGQTHDGYFDELETWIAARRGGADRG